MSIYGIGIDSVSSSRMKTVLGRTPSMLDKLFTLDEQRAALERGEKNSRAWASYLATAFTLKEAVAKSLGTGVVGFEWTDIHTGRDKAGKPWVSLAANARGMMQALDIGVIHVSVTTAGDIVTSMAISERLQMSRM